MGRVIAVRSCASILAPFRQRRHELRRASSSARAAGCAIPVEAREQKVIGVLVLDISEGRIHAISSVVNPDKLRHIGPPVDMRAFLRQRP